MISKICILFLLFSQDVSAGRCIVAKSCEKPCICPDTSLDNQTPAQVAAFQMKLANDIITTKIPNITKLGLEYLKISSQMLNGNNTFHIYTAAISAMWQSGNQPYLAQKPDGCAMAGMINATVECYKNYKNGPMLNALNLMNATMQANTDIMSNTTKIASGCTSEPYTPQSASEYILPRLTTCFGNGYVYKIEKIWKLRGGNLPEELKRVVLKMYRSNNFVDNFLAQIATFSLVPMNSAERFVNNSLQAALQLTSLQLVPKYPPCCCKNHLKVIADLTQGTKSTALQSMQTEFDIFSSPDACKCKKCNESSSSEER